MSKILITGGAGFIGSAILKHLNNEQHEIFVIDNLSFGNRAFIDIPDSHFYQLDILNHDELIKTIKKINPDKVIHLAAIHFIPYCNQHPFQSANINIQGTMNVLEAIKQTNCNQVLFASTAAVYPIYDGALSEEHETGPMDIYGLSKLTGEQLCQKFFLETGIATVICRFFNAFGPNETNPHLIPEIQHQIKSGKRTIELGNILPKRDFIHTYDMANAISIMIKKLTTGITTINLGQGEEYAVTEIVNAFERILNEKITIEIDEARVRKVERMHLLADVTKLKSLGWQPAISIDMGIKTLLEE